MGDEVELRVCSDVGEFYSRVEPYLSEREAAHCLILGILSTLLSGSGLYEEPPYLAYVEENGRVFAVGIRTPPYRMILSMMDEPQLAGHFAHSVYESVNALPGVIAPAEVSGAFARAWCAVSGQSLRLTANERLYQLDRVQDTSIVSGEAVPASVEDVELLVNWGVAFQQEALPHHETNRAALERFVRFRLQGGANQGGYWLWKDHGQFVAMAGYGGRTAHGMRIGPVYTPPDYRRRGYGTALTAEVSRYLLAADRKYVFLFTDLANPTSNHIYQTIGYVPVCDWDEYMFS